jgi:8-oxo-dGTP diphosphatase
MYTYDYPRPALTVDIAVFTLKDNQLQILLIQRANPPFMGYWALPGGFVDINESLEDAASRELEEETGFVNLNLDQLHTYGDPQRDPRGRVISVAYFAFIPSGASAHLKGGGDASQASWFPARNLPELAFDHQKIIDDAVCRLRSQLNQDVSG